ncbi:M15 family metallopeptidase [bacterium]|nr:M15 family metallopeptidase [bacterium]
MTMSKFYLGARSEKNLIGVHPDMVAVVRRAIQITPVDFGVTEGLRTLMQQEVYFKAGKSTTMNSKHLEQSDGYSHAVDLYCRDNMGNVTWEHKWFRLVVQSMFTAAIELGHKIIAGALWRTFQDSPHFELDV